ncbi:NAD(P)/FAD-dependent oxidoreductase [Tenacibaculum halocynthiae]|uniref:NAD(P)/FAD-dependent oxidoreductase n=1 Tax=Tenacibaculum halocynthiae TaxID=1254437 RepID=UPI003D64F720
MIKEVDYIIVGLGLAGISFAEELTKNNYSFVVYEDCSQTSSKVAGGVYNPVILKRFTPVWNGHEQLEHALPKYEELENKLQVKIDSKFKTRKVFNSIADENNWFVALDKPFLSNYMQPDILKGKIEGVIGDFGFGELKGTGRIDTHKLILNYTEYLRKHGAINEEKFIYDELIIEDEFLRYKDIKSTKIVFCEGFGITKNPFFNDLPLKESKGEILTIHSPELKIDFLLKSNVFVMPLGNDYYRVGATFNWTDSTTTPTKEGREELEAKLKNVISVPYKVTNHTAGIRPTVKDRRPLLGKHPKHSNLAVLNGLGTRGVMIGPTMAKMLFNHLEKGELLEKEVDINRFN